MQILHQPRYSIHPPRKSVANQEKYSRDRINKYPFQRTASIKETRHKQTVSKAPKRTVNLKIKPNLNTNQQSIAAERDTKPNQTKPETNQGGLGQRSAQESLFWQDHEPLLLPSAMSWVIQTPSDCKASAQTLRMHSRSIAQPPKTHNRSLLETTRERSSPDR